MPVQRHRSPTTLARRPRLTAATHGDRDASATSPIDLYPSRNRVRTPRGSTAAADARSTGQTAVPPCPHRTGSHSHDRWADSLAEALDREFDRSGKWAEWAKADDRLHGVSSLQTAVELSRESIDSRSRGIVAALTNRGSRRGDDDDDAALAVVVMLTPGITNLETRLRDLCEVDDIRTTLWEEVKLSEPQLNRLAASYLLRRTHRRLIRPAAGMLRRHWDVSLEEWTEWAEGPEAPEWTEHDQEPRNPLELALEHLEPEPAAERVVADVFEWARTTGALRSHEIDLLDELLAVVNTGAGQQLAQRLVGARRGVTERTIRRRRNAALARLRDAVPAYPGLSG